MSIKDESLVPQIYLTTSEGELVLPDEPTDEADRRREMLGETNRAYALLKADPEAWKEERSEHGLWDTE